MAASLASTCCSVSYDVLTICISIADVATDIWVLIDFYNKDRMIFFWISLSILILAQCSYSIACSTRFNTVDSWNECMACLTFFCLLPFGTLVAFIMYFGSDESQFQCVTDCLRYDLGLDAESWFYPQHDDSKMMKIIKQKLDRHLGFILEAAIEAFPQSLLQIVAIVYYQEANYIFVISIALSMFSVMTKSLILSQGIEKYTFFWTWLCVVTDFFGIFFTLTWVFYHDDNIPGDFLGYFNIFGEIWLWKFAISTAIPVAFALFVFFSVGYWFMYCLFLCDPDFDDNACVRCGFSCMWIILCM